MQHKWHKEIKAWADGAEIEYFDDDIGEWRNCTSHALWYEDDTYRIKPQPKEPQYYAVFINHKDEVRFNLWDKLCETPAEYKYAGKIKLEDE